MSSNESTFLSQDTIDWATAKSDSPGRETFPRALVVTTGSPVLDALIAPTDDGQPAKWPVGLGGTIRFSFMSAETAAASYNPDTDETNIQEVEDAVKNNVRAIFRQYGEVVPINFVEVPDSADSNVRIAYSNGPGPNGNAYAYYPGTPRGGAVHLQPANNANPSTAYGAAPGSYGYSTLIHEIGHALGLKHPGNYNAQANVDPGQQPENPGTAPFLEPAKDNIVNTIMSYNGDAQQDKGLEDPATLMALDIAALQFLYGVNRAARGENTTYGLTSQNLRTPQAIWDGGGNDTIDASALPAGDYVFDLADNGRLTERGALQARVYTGKNDPSGQEFRDTGYGWVTGFGANLENLVGTIGPDEIYGNNLPNVLQSGEGNDQIFGRLGFDTIDGGGGDDTIRAGNGFDVLLGGPGNDVLTGDRGRDLLTGGEGADVFVLRTTTFAPAPEFADVLTDFTPGVDTIGLTDGLTAADVGFVPFTLNGQAGTMLTVAASGNVLGFVPGLGADAIRPSLVTSPIA